MTDRKDSQKPKLPAAFSILLGHSLLVLLAFSVGIFDQIENAVPLVVVWYIFSLFAYMGMLESEIPRSCKILLSIFWPVALLVLLFGYLWEYCSDLRRWWRETQNPIKQVTAITVSSVLGLALLLLFFSILGSLDIPYEGPDTLGIPVFCIMVGVRIYLWIMVGRFDGNMGVKEKKLFKLWFWGLLLYFVIGTLISLLDLPFKIMMIFKTIIGSAIGIYFYVKWEKFVKSLPEKDNYRL